MPTYRLDLAYDGTDFHGYARQPGVRTVQGELEAALFAHTGPVETAVAGRTDKGVHASGQVVSFATEAPIDVVRVKRSLNRRLGPEIAALVLRQVADGFHARFDATSRAYVYRILSRDAPDPFLARYVWHVEHELDVAAMDRAARHFVGERDFASLCRKAQGRSTVRRVDVATWRREGDLVVLDIEASSFCHQMVRSVVALSVAVGRGRLTPDVIPDILDAEDRNASRGAAPPRGLTLVRVGYAESSAS